MAERFRSGAGRTESSVAPEPVQFDGFHPIIRLFDKCGMETAFGTPEARRATLLSAGYPAYRRFATWLNARTRGLTAEQAACEPYPHTIFVQADHLNEAAPFDEYCTDDIVYIAPSAPHREQFSKSIFHAAQRQTSLEAAGGLLWLGAYYTHGYSNSNFRNALTFYSLLTRGYGCRQRAFYSSIISDDGAYRKAIFSWDKEALPRQFGRYYLDLIAESYGYDGERPEGVTRFCLGEVNFSRLAGMFPYECQNVGMILAERHFNAPLALGTLLAACRDPEDYIVRRDGASLIDAEAFIDDLHYLDVTRLKASQIVAKSHFMRSIIDCFAGDESIFGPRDDILMTMRPHAREDIAS